MHGAVCTTADRTAASHAILVASSSSACHSLCCLSEQCTWLPFHSCFTLPVRQSAFAPLCITACLTTPSESPELRRKLCRREKASRKHKAPASSSKHKPASRQHRARASSFECSRSSHHAQGRKRSGQVSPSRFRTAGLQCCFHPNSGLCGVPSFASRDHASASSLPLPFRFT